MTTTSYSNVQKLLSSVWPEWQITGTLGKGTFGYVYEILRNDLGNSYTCAMKVLQMISDESDEDLEEFVQSVSHEIDMMMMLKGAPNIVTIEDYAVLRGDGTRTILIRMEKLESAEKLSKQSGGLSRQQTLQLGLDICNALISCEKENIIHRDIKLSNIFYSEKGGYKLGDFGISRTMDSIHEKMSMSSAGTIQYMAPEVYFGFKYDSTADIYSLGIALYILLNGTCPPLCSGYKDSPSKIPMAVLHAEADTQLAGIICAACDPDPSRRFSNASDFRDALQSYISHKPVILPAGESGATSKTTVRFPSSDTVVSPGSVPAGAAAAGTRSGSAPAGSAYSTGTGSSAGHAYSPGTGSSAGRPAPASRPKQGSLDRGAQNYSSASRGGYPQSHQSVHSQGSLNDNASNEPYPGRQNTPPVPPAGSFYGAGAAGGPGVYPGPNINQQNKDNYNYPRKTSPSRKPLAAIIALFAVLAVLVGLLVFLINAKSDSSSGDTPSPGTDNVTMITTYTVCYLDSSDESAIADQVVKEGGVGKTITVYAKTIEGYRPLEDEKTITLAEKDSDNIIKFFYEEADSANDIPAASSTVGETVEEPVEEPSPVDITYEVTCVDSEGQVLLRESYTDTEGTTVTVSPPAIEGYTTNNGDTAITLDQEADNSIVFVYEPTRGTDHLRTYYAGFSGYLSSDAYASYSLLSKESLGRIIPCGCLMHLRRRFAEALEIIRIGKLSKAQIEALPEYRALILLGRIYAVEGRLKNCTPEERLQARIKEIKPLMDEFYTFIDSLDQADPTLSEKLKDAVSYSLNHKETLWRFLEDGRVPCDNGFAENSIRIYAQGRRNWLFSNTPDGARASAIVYSMIETARQNNANPLLYMKYLLEKTPSYMDIPSNSDQLEELMPWSEVYRKYEEEELKRSMETVLLQSQDKPYYRPSGKKSRSLAQPLSTAG